MRATRGDIAARVAAACVALLCSTVLLPTTAAQAGQVLAPPGDAGANEYFETVPTVSGNRAPPTPTPVPATPANSGSATTGTAQTGAAGGQSSTNAPASSLARGEQALVKLGRDGQAAAALAAAAAPAAAAGGTGAESGGVARHGTGATSTTTPGAALTTVTLPAGESAADAVAHVVGGSAHGGLGVWLPVLLAAAVGAAVATLVARRRRPRGAGQ